MKKSLLTATVALAPAVASAQLIRNYSSWTINGQQVETIPQLIFAGVDMIVPIAIFIAGIVIIKSGFDMVMHAEDAGARGKAKNMLVNGVIGLAIILSAKAVALAIQATVVSLK